MCFLLGYCKSLGLERQNKAVRPPPELKGFLSGFPTSPNAHDAASVEEVMWLAGVAGVPERGSGEQAVSHSSWTQLTSCRAQRGQDLHHLVFPPAVPASLPPLHPAILCPGIHLITG